MKFCLSCMLCLVILVSIFQPASALRKKPTWNIQTKAQPDAQAGGWFINLGITGARGRIMPETPKILDVAFVFGGSPAAGKLQVGDKIVGVNGRPFSQPHKFGYGPKCFGYEGPMMDFGNALEESQGMLEGKLTLEVMRTDEQLRIEISLPGEYGAFSESYPYDCDKSVKHKKLQMTGAAPVVVEKTNRARQPNIMMIMIDDLGWKDLRCYGNPRLSTPHLDRLAQQGMRFTDAYAAAPVCSPTRAAVLTGLAPARLKITNHIPDQERFIPEDAQLLPAKMLDHLPLKQTTIAERLKQAGYATGFFGKWHLAGERVPDKGGQGDLRYYPEQQGFDLNLGGTAMGGPFSFFDPFELHNLPPKKTGQYMPDRFADEVIDFVRSNSEKPFFVCLWNYTVHWPMEAPADLIEKYKKRTDLGKLNPRYAAMIEAMDALIGRITQSLADEGIANNTLLIFTSDNGAYGGVADSSPLRAAKGFLYEGGIRIPQIIRWPGIVEPGAVCDVPVISMDLFPTILEAVGLDQDQSTPLDGESLMPLLKQTGSLKRSTVYFHYPNYAFHGKNRLGSAARRGNYKLIERFDDGSFELYDLKSDIGESENLAARHPDRVAGLSAALNQWRDAVAAEIPAKRELNRTDRERVEKD